MSLSALCHIVIRCGSAIWFGVAAETVIWFGVLQRRWFGLECCRDGDLVWSAAETVIWFGVAAETVIWFGVLQRRWFGSRCRDGDLVCSRCRDGDLVWSRCRDGDLVWSAAETVIFPIYCVWTDSIGHSFFHSFDAYLWSRTSAAPLMLLY